MKKIMSAILTLEEEGVMTVEESTNHTLNLLSSLHNNSECKMLTKNHEWQESWEMIRNNIMEMHKAIIELQDLTTLKHSN